MPFLIFTTLLCIAFFWPVLFGQEQFAFRDTADFYYPLFEYVQSELQAGRLPLWMPYENIGQPLAANPVCSVFYPVKLIFFLPIDFVLAYHLFVIVHVWLAALTAYRLARHWKRSETAAVFAGLCYAFGGIVLFQHNNVPFLIGSAWLPEAIRAADRLLIACRHRTTTGNRLRRGAIALSLVVSLMTLGGDIQCVYHTLLMIGLLIFLRRKRVQRRLFLQATVLSGILIFLLTAVQVIPFWEFMRSCDRAAHANESIEYTDTHEYMRYDYSSGPWRWIEFIWPNIDGQKFPVNTRWCQLFEQPKSVWTPSLYMGLGPVLLGLAAYRLRKRNAVRVWTVGVLCAAMLASLGYYGVGWLLALNGVDIASLGIHEPFGGVYWLMVNVLPGYGMFRYPAKLLSIAALPICLLAADGFDIFFSRQRAGETKTTNTIKRQKRQRRPIQQNASTTIQQCGKYDKCRFRRRMYGLIGILCVATLCFNVAGQTKAFWSYIEAHLAPDVIFGPIIVPLAKLQIVFSLLHFFLLMVAIGYFVWRVFRTAPGARTSPPLRLAFIALLAVDLYVANTCLIPTVPRSVFQEPLVNFEASANAVPPVRNIHITIWCPRVFEETVSQSRMTELVRWQREILFTKFNLRYRIANTNNGGSFQCADYVDWLFHPKEGLTPDEHYALLGVQYAIVPSLLGTVLNRFPGIEPTQIVAPFSDDVAILRVKNPRPRAWVEQDGRVLESAKAEIVRYEPSKVVIEADLPIPATVVLTDQFFPGWRAKVKPSNVELPIRRVESVFRGVDFAEPGQYRLTLEYDPMSFRIGLTLTLAGIVLLVGLVLKR